MNFCQEAIEILRKTGDGNKLSPQDLSLIETAVNGWLSEAGEAVFEELYRKVKNGNYRPQWLNGIEHVTRDHDGYVYWKGQHVEHYNAPWCYSDEGKQETIELANRCRHLERIGVKVNFGNAIWFWEKYKDIKKTEGS